MKGMLQHSWIKKLTNALSMVHNKQNQTLIATVCMTGGSIYGQDWQHTHSF